MAVSISDIIFRMSAESFDAAIITFIIFIRDKTFFLSPLIGRRVRLSSSSARPGAPLGRLVDF